MSNNILLAKVDYKMHKNINLDNIRYLMSDLLLTVAVVWLDLCDIDSQVSTWLVVKKSYKSGKDRSESKDYKVDSCKNSSNNTSPAKDNTIWTGYSHQDLTRFMVFVFVDLQFI